MYGKCTKSPPKFIKNYAVQKYEYRLFYWRRLGLSLEFKNICNKHAPWKVIKVNGRHLPWVDSDLISLFRQRELAWAKFRKTKDPLHWEVYSPNPKLKQQNQMFSIMLTVSPNIFQDPRQFWRKANDLLNKSGNQSINQVKFKNCIMQEPSATSVTNSHHMWICLLFYL